MTICTRFLGLNHPLNVISDIKNAENLPFSEILPINELLQHIPETNSRERVFTTEVVLWAFLSQVMDDDQSQQAAVARVIAASLAQKIPPPSSNTSAYSQARSRLSEDIISRLTREIAKKTASNTPSQWLWKGKHVKLVDGSTISMPDTPENQKAYPQPSSQKEGLGFPIARILAIIDYQTGMVLDFETAQYTGKNTGEHALLRQLMDSFNQDDIMIGDAYYPSFFLMASLIKRGISGVFPARGSRKYDFRKGKRLGKKDHIATWVKPRRPTWMTQEEYDEYPKDILVREVCVKNQKNGFRTKRRILVTTLLDATEVSPVDLQMLYDCRWSVELTLRSIKSTMHMDILRGKTPSMVKKEMWIHLLAYNLIRRIMAHAAWLYKRSTTSLSFKLALQVIKSFEQAGLFNEDNPLLYQKLFKAIVSKKIGNRPGRQEPRAIKRRPKIVPKLQTPRGLNKNVA